MAKRFYCLLLIYLSLAALSGIACELSTGATNNQDSSLPSGSILFQDDFSSNSEVWDTWTGEDGSKVVIEDETLHIVVQKPQYDYWSLHNEIFEDIRIEVTAAKLGGSNDNDFGLICRFQDKDNYYALLISSDGYSGVLKVKQGSYTLLGSGNMQYNEAIRRGDAVNLLRAECLDDRLILYANGEKIVEVMDSDVKSGRVGVVAGTAEDPGTNVYFDNFIVYQP